MASPLLSLLFQLALAPGDTSQIPTCGIGPATGDLCKSMTIDDLPKFFDQEANNEPELSSEEALKAQYSNYLARLTPDLHHKWLTVENSVLPFAVINGLNIPVRDKDEFRTWMVAYWKQDPLMHGKMVERLYKLTPEYRRRSNRLIREERSAGKEMNRAIRNSRSRRAVPSFSVGKKRLHHIPDDKWPSYADKDGFNEFLNRCSKSVDCTDEDILYMLSRALRKRSRRAVGSAAAQLHNRVPNSDHGLERSRRAVGSAAAHLHNRVKTVLNRDPSHEDFNLFLKHCLKTTCTDEDLLELLRNKYRTLRSVTPRSPRYLPPLEEETTTTPASPVDTVVEKEEELPPCTFIIAWEVMYLQFPPFAKCRRVRRSLGPIPEPAEPEPTTTPRPKTPTQRVFGGDVHSVDKMFTRAHRVPISDEQLEAWAKQVAEARELAEAREITER